MKAYIVQHKTSCVICGAIIVVSTIRNLVFGPIF